MKSLYLSSLVACALFASVAPGFAKQGMPMKKMPAPLCKHAMRPGADGSTAMAELPPTTLLYNYHHVRGSKPVIENLRALGALRCATDLDSSSFLIDLRSVFEAMGGTTSYSSDRKTITVAKLGVKIVLYVGVKRVAINGEMRPLDVPPIVYRNAIYVPIRLVSEGLGGYVQWDRPTRTVVVRYLPPAPATPTPPPPPTVVTAEPSATPSATPLPTPEPTPTPIARVQKYEQFVAGDYIAKSRTYNAFAPGKLGNASFSARAAFEFPLGNLPVEFGGDFRDFAYTHDAAPYFAASVPQYVPCPINGYQGCVSTPGKTASVYVPKLDLSDTSYSANVGIGIAHKSYLAASFLSANNNYPNSYPDVPALHGFGFGVDRLPDLENSTSVYFSVFDYPQVSANYTSPAGLPGPSVSGKIQENLFKYQVGFTAAFGSSGLFLDTGFLGDLIRGYGLSTGKAEHAGAYIGLGIKL